MKRKGRKSPTPRSEYCSPSVRRSNGRQPTMVKRAKQMKQEKRGPALLSCREFYPTFFGINRKFGANSKQRFGHVKQIPVGERFQEQITTRNGSKRFMPFRDCWRGAAGPESCGADAAPAS